MAPAGSRLAGTVLAVLLVPCLARFPAAAEPPPGLRTLLRPGERAPAFTLSTLDGERLTYRPGGGASLVVFWSAFCPLCRELLPSLNDPIRRNGERIRALGVNLDGPRFKAAVRTFLAENDLPYPVVLDVLEGDYFVASDRFGIEKTPTALLVDGAGIVRGAYPAERIRDLLRDFDGLVSALQQGS